MNLLFFGLRQLRPVACFLFGAGLAFAAGGDLIPVEKFFADAAIAHIRIAPDGRHLAFLAPMQGRVGIALMDLATGKVEPLVRAGDENMDTFYWKNSDTVLFMADVGGNEGYALQAINLKSRRIQRLLESWGENNAGRQGGHFGGVLTFWSTNPKKIIVRGSKTERSWSADIYEVDVLTGKRTPVGAYVAQKGERWIMFDNSGKVRLQAIDTEEYVSIQARLGDDMKFTELMRQPRDLYLSGLDHRTILADNRTLLFVDYSKHDRGALVAWDLVEGVERKELFTPPEGEITDLLLGRSKEKLLGVRYLADKEQVHWMDEQMAAIQRTLDQALPETINRITDWSDDMKRIIVHSYSDVESGINFILDLTGTQPRLMPLGSAHPELEAKQLAPMKVVRFKARDGLELQGYLTLPRGANGPVPLIINPHGGPYGIRDEWGFVGEVQFLANRGYGVLQVNYRGSGGFGRKFLEAGRLEWGRKMQDDLTDAVHWAIEQGYTKADNVAIYGASYGGYAALAGATFTPDLYKCAVNYVGVADLTYLGRRDQGGDRIMNEFFYMKWIHPDMEELARRSPVNHVQNIRIPTLHAYGENDPRVEWRQWKKLKAELDKHGIRYETFNQGDEGHGFSNAPARVQFYLKLEEFLAKHLAGGVKLGEVKALPTAAQ